jgi:hypothetical protein
MDNQKLLKFLDFKVTTNKRRHKLIIEAAFCEFLLKNNVDTRVDKNIFLGFPTPGLPLPYTVKNHITAFSSLGHITEQEIAITEDFINKKIVDKFKSRLNCSTSIINSVELSALDNYYKIVGNSATQISHAINSNMGKYLQGEITLEVIDSDSKGKAFIIVKTPLAIEYLKKTFNAFSFAHCKRKCNFDLDLTKFERSLERNENEK